MNSYRFSEAPANLAFIFVTQDLRQEPFYSK